MPTWVQSGGLENWIEHLKDPATRAKVIAEMRDDHAGWENLARHAGPDGVLFAGFKNPALRKYIGKTLADVAKERGVSPEDAAIDLVIEDGSRVDTIYFLMKEENVARQTGLPWMSFGSDAEASAPEGLFLTSSTHPRAYGNFARFLGKYVRDEKRATLPDAIRRLSHLPTSNLGIKDRGLLKKGYYADVVVFDPAKIQDHATFEKPMQFATGVDWVLVNGGVALSHGNPTALATGRVVRGPAWKGRAGGGCKASAKQWKRAW
jgi:N-acyl-D-amino-acid deacylase